MMLMVLMCKRVWCRRHIGIGKEALKTQWSSILIFFCDQACKGSGVVGVAVSSRQGLGEGSRVNCRADGRFVPGFEACLE